MVRSPHWGAYPDMANHGRTTVTRCSDVTVHIHVHGHVPEEVGQDHVRALFSPSRMQSTESNMYAVKVGQDSTYSSYCTVGVSP